jgi:altronate dehydratase large subunit
MNFLGYERPDGSVGVRNHVVVIPAGRCSNELAATIADGVKGVVAILHNETCPRLKPDLNRSLQTLIGLGSNPNVAGALVVGIGCDPLSASEIGSGIAKSRKQVEVITIEETGGFKKTVDRGQAAARHMMSQASQMTRRPYDLSYLCVGLKCGGSDTTSALTGDPAAGWAVDAVLKEDGQAIFSETVEIIGAEHILANRAVDQQTRVRLLEIIGRKEKTIKASGVDIRGTQPTPGNIKGGLTTLEEKSLGAIIKAGTAPLQGVLEYAEGPQGKGLFFMDSTANTPQIFLGLAAAGAQIVVFVFGGGLPTCFGSFPAAVGGLPIIPVLKILSSPKDKEELEYFDIYAGTVIEGEESIAQVGARLLQEIVNTASGKLTKSEMRSDYREVLEMYSTGPIL